MTFRTATGPCVAGVMLMLLPVQAQPTTPAVLGVVNEANRKPALGAGARALLQWWTATGRLPTGEETCDAGPMPAALPVSLCGMEVLVNGVPSPLQRVTPWEILFVLPSSPGEKTVAVSAAGVRSEATAIEILPAAPALYQSGAGLLTVDAGAVNTIGEPLTAKPGGAVTLAMLATGAGVSGDLRVSEGTAVPDDAVYSAPIPEISVDDQPKPESVVVEAVQPPGTIGIWRYVLSLVNLTTGAHRLKFCLWGRCDEADILVKQEGEAHSAGRLALHRLAGSMAETTVGVSLSSGETDPDYQAATVAGHWLLAADGREGAELRAHAGPNFAEYRAKLDPKQRNWGVHEFVVLPELTVYPEFRYHYVAAGQKEIPIPAECKALFAWESNAVACAAWRGGGKGASNLDMARHQSLAFSWGPGGSNDSLVAMGTKPRYWPRFPIPLALNLTRAPAIQQSFQGISPPQQMPLDVASRKVVEAMTSGGSPIFEMVEDLGERSGIYVTWESSGNWAALPFCIRSGRGTPCQVQVNITPGVNWSMAQTLQHELLHAIGLGHDPDPASNLYYSAQTENFRTFTGALERKYADVIGFQKLALPDATQVDQQSLLDANHFISRLFAPGETGVVDELSRLAEGQAARGSGRAVIYCEGWGDAQARVRQPGAPRP